MLNSSDKIGALAAALAKAQSEISNPEKSLTATITSPFPREANRSFRYASLSTGLDLVRKCLGQHEIAVVQATAIEKDRDLIRLTTTLVHSSGEWVSSDWPVCPVSETAAPHRLGAALTYARRYALFTLVGIAGEDDLDAPDLPMTAIPAEPEKDPPTSNPHQNGSGRFASERKSGRLLRARSARAQNPNLTHQARENILDQLMVELAQLGDADELAVWAYRSLPLKNQLSKKDAETLEVAFATKLSGLNQLTDPMPTLLQNHEAEEGAADPTQVGPNHVMGIRKPVRERDRNHLRFVATQPCLVCGRTPSDAHHLKFAERPAMGRKVSDKFTVPVCRLHHRDLHGRGNERSWWDGQGIDPLPIAANLWRTSHADASTGAEIVRNADGATTLNGKHRADGSMVTGRAAGQVDVDADRKGCISAAAENVPRPVTGGRQGQ
jgi:hypothetical protein